MVELDTLRRLLEQGKYAELRQTAEDRWASPEAQAEAAVWHVRGLLEQGYVGRALEALQLIRFEAATDQTQPHTSDLHQRVELWTGFTAVIAGQSSGTTVRLDDFLALCDQIHGDASPDMPVFCLAVDLRARAEAIRDMLAGRGADTREATMDRMTRAADHYAAAGMHRDAAATLRRAALIGAAGRAAERAKARELLARSLGTAREQKLRLAVAEAQLGLADLDLRDVLDGASTAQAEVLAELDRLAAEFTDAGHAFGQAKVAAAVGLRLLTYGVPAGVELAHDAARQLADADVPSAEEPLWAALNVWHTLRGEAEQAVRAHDQRTSLARATGHVLAADVHALGAADQAIRGGVVADAGPLLEAVERSRTSAALPAASRIMAAVAASSVGLAAEARALLEGVVEELTAANSTLVLGEALAVLASLLAGQDAERAADLLHRAASVAEEAEAFTEQARYLAQAAWSRVVHRRVRRLTPIVDDAASRDFERAEQVLLEQRVLTSRQELVNLYQYRGQASFFTEDWDACGHWLGQAENVARTFELRPQLAAMLCHQALALIQIGRRTGPSAYDDAARLLEESLALYRSAGPRSFVWRVLFFRALCDIEAARWPHEASASPEPVNRLDHAGELLEEASQEIDLLRRSSEDGAVARRQQVWAAFSVDKQTFYEQAFQLAWDVRGDGLSAWVWLERAKARALLDALADSDAGPTDAAAVGAGTGTGTGTADGRAEAAQRSAPMGFDELRALLISEEASTGRRVVLAQYLCTPRRTLLFLATSQQEQPAVIPIPLDHTALRTFAATSFRVPGAVRMMGQDLADGGLGAWHRFAGLVEPLERYTRPDDVIYLAPHGILHDLPLHTLPVGGAPLIERNPVCYVPGAAVLRHTLGDAGAGIVPSRPAVVFGDPRGDLPNARREAVEIAGMLGVEPRLGPEVTREHVVSALGDAGLVHLAAHGRVSTQDGFDSFVQLADDDRLRAADLLTLRSTARLVVLSGCETGLSEQRAGEELIGFTRALLLSGVPSTVCSQWRVGDDSTRALLARFHRAASQGTTTPADALRDAVREIRAQPGREHLYHWGGFVLVGSWR